MIVRVAPSEAMTRRAAFTLMEVLVVVAIVVILASVGTIATLTFLKNAKEDKARQQMMNLEMAEKTWALRNSGNQLQNGDITPLADFLDQGQNALIDPWGQMFRVEYVQTQNSTGITNYRAVFSTTNQDNGQQIMHPNINAGQ
jgi:general secretion pathway protein G